MTARGLILPWRGVLPTLCDDVFLAPGATVIGDVVIGAESSVWFGCVVRGDVNEIRIGARVNLQDGTIVHASERGSGTYVGDDVTVGHMALLHACRIGAGAFVGMRATVMDDAEIEPGAMLAAGALLPPGKRAPAGELWAGSPARKLRDLGDADRAAFADSARRYAAYAAEYRGNGVG